MALFEGEKFLFLPNCNSSTLRFLSLLISSNGGTVIKNVRELDKQMITIVNESFIGAGGRLENSELFLKEFNMDANVVWGFVLHERPVCVRASCISRWLKLGKITFDRDSMVTIDQKSTEDIDLPVAAEGSGEISKEFSGHELTSGSQTDADIASPAPRIGSGEKSVTRLSTNEEIPLPETSSTVNAIDYANESKNQMLVDAVGRLARRYEIKGDQFRARGYKLAKIGIERFPHVIHSGEQARRSIASVGPSIAKKIQIILDSGSLPGLDESFELEKNIKYFTQCHDVGVYSAKRWNLLGLKSFTEVSKKFPELFIRDWPILFGWSFYEDWLMKIKRVECEEILKVVQDNLAEIDSKCRVELQGSYIRGALECGDIDILFYKEGCDSTSELGRTMERLALILYEKGYVECFLQLSPRIRKAFGHRIKERVSKCKLTVPIHRDYPPAVDGLRKYFLGFKLQSEFKSSYLSTSADDSNKLKPDDSFMSLNSIEHPCRRVDFFCCRWSEIGAARIQWTGPKEFNRWIRLRASQKGMKLTQHGLYSGEDILLESFDEKRIFDLLGETYVGPEDRSSTIKKRQKQNA